MTYSLFGNVVGVRRFANGDIEIDFFHDDDKILELRYSKDPNKLGNISKELAEPLADTLSTDICSEIHFDDSDSLTHIEFEECDDEDEEDEDFDSE